MEIAGRGTAGAFARLYLDNAEQATAAIAEGGDWQASLAGVAPGLYTLRVDQIDTAGFELALTAFIDGLAIRFSALQ